MYTYYKIPTPSGSDEAAGGEAVSGPLAGADRLGGVDGRDDWANAPGVDGTSGLPAPSDKGVLDTLPLELRFGGGAGSETNGSRGRDSALDVKDDVRASGSWLDAVARTEFHGLSRYIDGTSGRALVVDHGFAVMVEDPSVCAIPGLRGDDGRRSWRWSCSPHTPISSRVFSSPPCPESLPPSERPLKSFATPPYASCTTESAAVAFDENFPHIERTLPEENRSAT